MYADRGSGQTDGIRRLQNGIAGSRITGKSEKTTKDTKDTKIQIQRAGGFTPPDRRDKPGGS
jgi:hypothetical protein